MNIRIVDMFQTLAEILKETEPEPSFSQLVHDHIFQLSKEFEHYFPTTKDPQSGSYQENNLDTVLNKRIRKLTTVYINKWRKNLLWRWERKRRKKITLY